MQSTTELVARWRQLADEHGPERVLYLAAHPGAAADVRRRMVNVSQAAGSGVAVGPLVVSTPAGFALDLVRRHVPGMADVIAVGGAARRAAVADACASAAWSASATVANRRAFVATVQQGIEALGRAQVSADDVLAHAAILGARDRWQELVAFRTHYEAGLRAAGRIDVAEAPRLAVQNLDAVDRDRFVEIIVDDAHTLSFDEASLIDGYAAATGCAVTRAEPTGAPDVLAGAQLVWCRHPSMEADAVVGALLAAHDDGTAWDDMAVVVPRRAAPIGRAVARALQRREVPVQIRLADGDAEPVVRRLRAALALADNTAPAAPFVEDWIQGALADLAATTDLVAPEPSVERALNALVAFDRATQRWATGRAAQAATIANLARALADDDFTLWYDAPGGGGVSIVTPEESAGLHWAFAVATSCVEGEYPRAIAQGAWFDPSVCGRDFVSDAPARRRYAIAAQRQRFALAASRAQRVTFVAAPQPGVLVSRYVEHLPITEARPAWPEPRPYPPRPLTVTTTPIHPSRRLRLSASQLSTFEDCPRRWFYDSVLRLADSSSVWTDFGTLIHNVLERFMAPDSTIEYSFDALLDLADEMWSDDIARFAPQRDQARREVRDVLATWWSMEGERINRADVVEVEHEFDVAVGDHAVRGRIDRVDWDHDRDGLAVVDYKTGRHPPKESEVADDLQLAVYYLAALRSAELAAKGAPTRLELLYIRLNKRFSQPITEDHEARAEARILDAAAVMLEEKLDPLPTADCDHCDYHRLCPLQRKGREVGAR